jgi:hypothetical protein
MNRISRNSFYQLFRNLEYINHAKEDCHLMYYEYRDM